MTRRAPSAGLPVSGVTVDPQTGAITIATVEATAQDSVAGKGEENEWDRA
jgi:hypothetical protein